MQIFTSEDILKSQLEQISAEQAAKAKPIEPAKAVGVSYNAELQRLVASIKKDIDALLKAQIKELTPQYTADSVRVEFKDGWYDVIAGTLKAIREKWTGERFEAWARGVANSFVRAADLNNAQKAQNQYKGFGVDVFTGNETINEYLKASAGDNARLIKSIPEQYLTQVESIVTTNMRAGNRPSAIIQLLIDQFGVTKRRAKMISRDQTAKINSNLAQKRMRSAGITHFKWQTSSDERVRDRHSVLANRVTKYGKGIYSWEELPDSDKGVPIAPGEDYQCRCVAVPVLPSQIERNKKAGLTNPKVKK